MTHIIHIQNVSQIPLPLTRLEIRERVYRALADHKTKAELAIRFVTPEEMTELNSRYRQQNKTTNVLAFPCELPDGVSLEYTPLGDVIICPQVLFEESKCMHKSLKSHFSLIIVHGVLHLLGYDHIKESDAKVMQALEIKLLAQWGYENPYENEDEEFE